MKNLVRIFSAVLLGLLVNTLAMGSPAHANWVKKAIMSQKSAESRSNKPSPAPKQAAQQPAKKVPAKQTAQKSTPASKSLPKQPVIASLQPNAAGAPQQPTDTQMMMSEK